MSTFPPSDSNAQADVARHLAFHQSSDVAPTRRVMTALAGLVFVDMILRFGGYQSLRRRLLRCTLPAPSAASDRYELARATAALDRAAVYYPRQAMCLQRSAVLTWLLRRHGVPAQFVIGCRHTPFYAHAWVEVDGIVVNDIPSVKDTYPAMERI